MTDARMSLAEKFSDSVLNWTSRPMGKPSADDVWVSIIAGTVSRKAEEQDVVDSSAFEALIDEVIEAARKEHGDNFSQLAAAKTRDVLVGFIPAAAPGEIEARAVELMHTQSAAPPIVTSLKCE